MSTAPGKSVVLLEAAQARLARMRLLGVLDDLDRKHGSPSAEVRAEVDREARRIFRR